MILRRLHLDSVINVHQESFFSWWLQASGVWFIGVPRRLVNLEGKNHENFWWTEYSANSTALEEIVVYSGICTLSDVVGAPLVWRIVCCCLSFYVIALYVLSVELQSGNLAFAILFALFCDFVFGVFYPLLTKYVPRHGHKKMLMITPTNQS